MNCKDLLDVYFSLTKRFDFLWNFYTFFVVALGGYLISGPNKTFSEVDKLIIIVGYSLFVIMNIIGLVITSRSLRTVSNAIYYCVGEDQKTDFTVVRVLVRRNHHLDSVATFIVHGAMLTLVVMLVYSR